MSCETVKTSKKYSKHRRSFFVRVQNSLFSTGTKYFSLPFSVAFVVVPAFIGQIDIYCVPVFTLRWGLSLSLSSLSLFLFHLSQCPEAKKGKRSLGTSDHSGIPQCPLPSPTMQTLAPESFSKEYSLRNS